MRILLAASPAIPLEFALCIPFAQDLTGAARNTQERSPGEWRRGRPFAWKLTGSVIPAYRASIEAQTMLGRVKESAVDAPSTSAVKRTVEEEAPDRCCLGAVVCHRRAAFASTACVFEFLSRSHYLIAL